MNLEVWLHEKVEDLRRKKAATDRDREALNWMLLEVSIHIYSDLLKRVEDGVIG